MIKKNFLFIFICLFIQMECASHMQQTYHEAAHQSKKGMHYKRTMSYPSQVVASHPVVVNNRQIQNGVQSVGQMIQPRRSQGDAVIPQDSWQLDNFMQAMGGMRPAQQRQTQKRIVYHGNAHEWNGMSGSRQVVASHPVVVSNRQVQNRVQSVGQMIQPRRSQGDAGIPQGSGQLDNFMQAMGGMRQANQQQVSKRTMNHRGDNHGWDGMSYPSQVENPQLMRTNNGQVQNEGQVVGQMMQPGIPQGDTRISRGSGSLDNFMHTMGGIPQANQQQTPMVTTAIVTY